MTPYRWHEPFVSSEEYNNRNGFAVEGSLPLLSVKDCDDSLKLQIANEVGKILTLKCPDFSFIVLEGIKYRVQLPSHVEIDFSHNDQSIQWLNNGSELQLQSRLLRLHCYQPTVVG